MQRRSLRAVLGACVVAVVLSGCAAALIGGGAVAGVGVVAFRNGALQTMEDVEYGKAWQAAKTAMGDLEYTILSEKKDALEGKLVAQTGDGTKVKVDVRKMNEKTVKFTIRVGTFGDEVKSRLILKAIEARC